jgi:CheY-like chemotaxis protein
VPPAPDGHVRLVHWKEGEVPERSERLEALGYEVDGTVPGTSIGVRALSAEPPIAFVIDLGRLPSHGLEVARSLRGSKALREIPIVFVDGKPDKVTMVEEQLPDASYADWDEIGAALEEAMANPPVDPIVPVSASGPRSGRPLAAKLGIKQGQTVLLVDAPSGFERTLGELPPAVTLRRGSRGSRDLTIWFVTSARELDRRIAAIAKAVGEGTLWAAWPKGSSGVPTDLVESRVQDAALAIGLVDTKVVAIDDTWSGLRLTRRRS